MMLWKQLGDEIHDKMNILCPYEIPLTIPILECILKRNELTMYKDSIYFIFFKLRVDPSHTSQRKSTILYSTHSMLSAFMTNTNLIIGRAF